jgi:hypothetical protein
VILSNVKVHVSLPIPFPATKQLINKGEQERGRKTLTPDD